MVEYSKTPIALVYENILTEYQCNSLINFVKNNNLLFKSEVYNKQTNKIEFDSVRTSSNCSVFYEEHIVAVEIRKIVSDIIKLPIENFEPIQIVRYEVGEHYGLHYDYFEEGNTDVLDEGGQRLWTAFIYLNDVDSGGETNFVYGGEKIKPRRGRMVLWRNYFNGKPVKESLHEGLPPISDEKWACNVWIREGIHKIV